jgi:hypothetical protein
LFILYGIGCYRLTLFAEDKDAPVQLLLSTAHAPTGNKKGDAIPNCFVVEALFDANLSFFSSLESKQGSQRSAAKWPQHHTIKFEIEIERPQSGRGGEGEGRTALIVSSVDFQVGRGICNSSELKLIHLLD